MVGHFREDYRSGRGNYDAITIAGNKRLSHGLQFTSNYTFARNLSNVGGYDPTSFATQAGGTVTDIYNYNLDYGNVAFTHRNRFLATFLYELPFGRKGLLLNKASMWVDGIIGGWQLSGVVLFQTGPFLTVVAPGADPAGNNAENYTGAQRADVVAGAPLYPANQTVSQWINPAAFAKPANNIGRPGDAPVGDVVGPGTSGQCHSPLPSRRGSRLKERARLQFGAQVANAFNHPNYAVPSNLNVATSGFGSITNVQTQENGGPRTIMVSGRLNF